MDPSLYRLYPRWAASVVLGAADTSKDIKAAPGAGKALRITTVVVSIITSAAQTLDIEDEDGTVEVLKLPASATGQHRIELAVGILLTANKKLIAKPAAAGPAAHIVAEGVIEPTASGA